MLEHLPAELVRQQSLAEIVLLEDEQEPRRAFTYFTYWMIVHGVACWLAGRRIPILAIELRCSQPDFCDDYQVMFSENLRFDRPRTRMIFSADCLDAADQAQRRRAQAFLAHAPANILVKYRDPRAWPAASSTICGNCRPNAGRKPRPWRSLCMSASTLRRRLAEEGQTYQGSRTACARNWRSSGWRSRPSASRDRHAPGVCRCEFVLQGVSQVVGVQSGALPQFDLNEAS
jgi:hypothetical protein